LLREFARIAQADFGDIVRPVQLVYRRSSLPEKLRLHLVDNSFADVWVNATGSRYSFHWEARATRGEVYRWDNAPDFPSITTFPKHFHNGSESQVEESYLDDDLSVALRQFLEFVRKKLAPAGSQDSAGRLGHRCDGGLRQRTRG